MISNPGLPTFLAIDGEGTNRDDGTQDYTLLCASNGAYLERYRVGGLATHDIFHFLLRLSGPTLVGFFIGYDVTMWLHDLSPRHKTALWEAGWTVWKHAGIPYLIEWLPGKVFTLSIVSARLSAKARHSTRNVKPPSLKAPRVTIYDVGGFFQCSFVKALEEWGIASEEEASEIEEMKGLRNDFAALVGDSAGRDRVRAYCLSECRALVSLMDTLAATLWSAQIFVQSWHGAGAVAGMLFKTYEVKKALPRLPADILPAVMGAYYGGRTELYQQGLITQPLWVYDINSAYPTALVDIPDLSGAVWEWRDGYDPNQRYGVWDVSWDTRRQGRLYGPLPYRRDGRMFYPYRGRGWTHGVELLAACLSFGEQSFIVHGGWCLQSDASARAFGFVEELAAARLAYKRDDDPRHRVLKLGLNSLYGKLAQKQKSVDRVPPFQNYYLAGYVTAQCRSRLLPALRLCDEGLVMVATDGIFTTTPITVEEGPNLGQWEVKGPYENVLTLQSGVLFTPEDAGEHLRIRRTRGFNKSTLVYSELLAEWRRNGHAGIVGYRESRFLGLGAGYARHDMGVAGRWVRKEDTNARRELRYSLYPTKLPNTNLVTGRRIVDVRDTGETIYLIPNDGYLGEWGSDSREWAHSDAYTPGHLASGELAREIEEEELRLHEFLTQPDWEEQR